MKGIPTPAGGQPPWNHTASQPFVMTFLDRPSPLHTYLIASALFNRIPLHVYGYEDDGLPEYDREEAMMQKVSCTREVALGLPAATVLLFVDGNDVVFNRPLEDREGDWLFRHSVLPDWSARLY